MLKKKFLEKKVLLSIFLTFIFVSQGSAKVLLLAPDDMHSLWGMEYAKNGLLDTGLFRNADIVILSCRNFDPSLNQLQSYDAILLWSNYRFHNPENMGNILKQYVDSGGKLVMSTYCFSHRRKKYWQIEGGILNPGYSPFLPGNVQSVAGILNMNSISDKDHPIFANISNTPRFWSNCNYSNPKLNSGGRLLASDSSGNRLIAQNATGNIIAINIYPGYFNLSETNIEAKRLVANALIFLLDNYPKIAISPASAIISASKNSVSVNVKNLNQGTMNWTATANNSWIKIQSGSSGINNGIVTLDCDNNPGSARTGIITIRASKTLNSPQTFHINQSANTYPTISAISDQRVNEDTTTSNISFTINDAETPENLFVLARSSNHYLVSDNNITIGGSGTNRWLVITPNSNQFGDTTIRVDVSDGNLTSQETFTLSVDPVNDPPAFVKGGDQTHSEDDGQITVNNWALCIMAGPANESSQSIEFFATTTNESLFLTLPQIDSSGTLTYQLAADAYGTASVNIYLKDNGGTNNGGNDSSAIQQLLINVVPVNDAPVFTKGPNLEVWEDAPFQSLQWATDISAGPNEDHQALTFYTSVDKNSLFVEPPSLTPDGILTYQTAPDMNGTAIVEVFLKDDGTRKRIVGDTSEKQFFSITIKPVNDAPSFSVTDLTILEDAGPQSITSSIYDISTGPENESDQSINFFVTSNNNELFIQQPTISSEGILTFETTPDINGTADLSIYSIDDGGTDRNGNDTSETRKLTITVRPVNDPPVFTKGQSQYILEDAQPQEIFLWARDIVPGPQNESDQQVSFIVTNDNENLFSEQPAISPNGKLTYAVVPETGGLANIEVRLTDDGGIEYNGISYTDIQTFKIVVREINDTPVFVKGADQIIEKVDTNSNGQIVENWATQISPGPNESYQQVKFNVTTDNDDLFIQPPKITENGTLMYTPAANVNGRAKCTVSLEDDSSYAIDDNFAGTYISPPQEFMILVGDSDKLSLKISTEGCDSVVEVDVNGAKETSPYDQDVNDGDSIRLLAVPSENCMFDSWSDTDSDTNPRSFTITENKIIVANFSVKEEVTLTVTNIGNGKTMVNNFTCVNASCRYTFLENTRVNLKAIPNNYLTHFDSWSGIDVFPSSSIQLTITDNKSIDAHFSEPTGVWASVFKVEGENYGAIHTDEVTLGVGVENVSEPDASPELYSCSISIEDSEENQQLLIQKYGQSFFNWTIGVNAHGNVGPPEETTVKLSWNPSLFEANGLYQLREGIGNSGKIVLSNMKSINELMISGNNAIQYFTITYNEFLEFEFHLNQGWNLISIPVIPNNTDLNALFEDAEIAYCFIGGEYVSVSVLQPGYGYWLKVPSDNSYIIKGARFSNHAYLFKTGWQLIGPIFKETVHLKDNINGIYRYNGEYYDFVEHLQPGFGYWVNASKNFSITISD